MQSLLGCIWDVQMCLLYFTKNETSNKQIFIKKYGPNVT